MQYEFKALPHVPPAADPAFQHVVETYSGEINKCASTWRQFHDADLGYRPHPKSATVEEIMKHELLSERRFFAEFLGSPEPAAGEVLPAVITVDSCTLRLADLAAPRLTFLASRPSEWWLEVVPFFDVRRERIWIFWRRVLHTAHHRTQLTVYLRLLDRSVPSTYGPTADVTWKGADPTTTVEAANRR